MATLEETLREMGRDDIADNFKQLAYRSYSKEPVVVVGTHHVNSTPEKDSTDGSGPDHRRISEFLDTAGGLDDMFAGDDGGSPRLARSSQSDRDEVFAEEGKGSPDPMTEETVVAMEKHKVVDEDGNAIEESQGGNEISTEDTEKLLQDFFGNDKGVLDFLGSSSDAPAAVENGGDTEETEI